MHAHELADLAAIVAVHGDQLISADAATMDRTLVAYWKASRCRFDRWYCSLALLAKHKQRSGWAPLEIATFEEIVVSEILTRVVATIAVAYDERHHANDAGPIGQNIFTAHLDAKRRAIALVIAPHRNQKQTDEFLALRRQCDRWTDLLLAYLLPHAAVDEFAANPARVGDFAYDAREHLRSGASSDMAVTMIVAGIRSSLGSLGGQFAPNTDLNLEIATALVGGFAPDFFDSHGHLRSMWLERLRTVPNESPVNIDNWWHTAPHGAHDVSRPARWRR